MTENVSGLLFWGRLQGPGWCSKTGDMLAVVDTNSQENKDFHCG